MTGAHEHSQSLQWYDGDWQPVGEPIEVRDWAEVRAEAHRRGLTGQGDAHCCLPPRPNPNDRFVVRYEGVDRLGEFQEGAALTLRGQSEREFVAVVLFPKQWQWLHVVRPLGGNLYAGVAEIRDGRIVWAEQ